MKKALIITIVLCLSLIGLSAAPITKVIILFSEQSNATALLHEASYYRDKQEQRNYVINALKQQSFDSQSEILGILEDLQHQGMVDDIESYWLVNCISCTADPSVIPLLEQRREVITVYRVEEAQWIFEDEAIPASRGDGREITQNLLQVNAPEVWAQGYTGAGILIALIDTGVRLDHADLEGRLWDGGSEYPNHGYDFYYHDNDPSDDRGHGTHVAGTICGTGASGSQTGIAPGATIMALKAFNNEGVGDETNWVAAMQFALEHGADLMNMSLGRPQPDAVQKLMMRQACDNTLAAGVVVAACAGNIRQMQFMVPVPYNIYTPGDCPPPHLHEDQLVNAGGTSCVICVGAVDSNNNIAQFSSQGPSQWTDVAAYNDYPYTSGSTTEIGLIRPDICAPGVQIKSLDYNTTNGYTLMDGTSMATPLVAGTIALMLSKNPNLTPAQIDEILERTAQPLTPHKSNDFGAGLLDALAAVNSVNYTEVHENGQTVTIYPNPSASNFTVAMDGMLSVSVFTLEGRLLKTINTQSDECRIEGLSNGVYILKTHTRDGILVNKIVKM
ncbi:MAG: S8 family peptidase [Bacteroidales bacterium]|nr:S8 family peptidase [Bacteroidales bacterium]MBR4148472.1 S8 family peptidase [Bacteroidales bacterium]